LFRGSELNSHCQITAQGRKVLEDDLGIRSDVDLRGSGEECLPALDAAHVQYVNIPLASYDMIASPEYTRRYRQVFGLLALPAAYPIYLHCWGGADRTGTVCFLLGALLGMREADLELDYELTSLSVWGERSIASEAYQEMRQTLALFAHKGSPLQHQVERYFRVIGVTPQEVASIRAIFLK
jgi:protein tyrosine/serine phosphatase